MARHSNAVVRLSGSGVTRGCFFWGVLFCIALACHPLLDAFTPSQPFIACICVIGSPARSLWALCSRLFTQSRYTLNHGVHGVCVCWGRMWSAFPRTVAKVSPTPILRCLCCVGCAPLQTGCHSRWYRINWGPYSHVILYRRLFRSQGVEIGTTVVIQ